MVLMEGGRKERQYTKKLSWAPIPISPKRITMKRFPFFRCMLLHSCAEALGVLLFMCAALLRSYRSCSHPVWSLAGLGIALK